MKKTVWKPTKEQVLQGISYLRGAFKVVLENDHLVAQKAALRAILESDIDRSHPLMKEAYTKLLSMKKGDKKPRAKRVVKPKSASIDDVINMSMADVINSAAGEDSKPKPGESISDFTKRIKREVTS